MKIERMEVVGVNVRDLQKATRLFSEILEVEFTDFAFGVDVDVESRPVDAKDAKSLSFEGSRIAIDKAGFLELIQTDPAAEEEGFRNIHFKVPSLDEAKAELRSKGIRMIADTTVGNLREAIFHPDDLHGIRLCLIEYDAPSMIEALMQKPGSQGSGSK